MLTRFICAAMQHAVFEQLDDGLIYGEIPALQGVIGTGATLDACREDLQGALEAWIVVGLHERHPLPAIDGVELTIEDMAV